jgi:hypothetical protein
MTSIAADSLNSQKIIEAGILTIMCPALTASESVNPAGHPDTHKKHFTG